MFVNSGVVNTDLPFTREVAHGLSGREFSSSAVRVNVLLWEDKAVIVLRAAFKAFLCSDWFSY